MKDGIAKSHGQFPELADARVLLVDDDMAIADLIVAMIKDKVAVLHTAHTCDDAVAANRTGRFNIALVDIHLPDGNGVDVVARLRQEQPLLCPIMITGFVNDEMAQKLETAHIDTLLTKPFSPVQLYFCICRELARKKAKNMPAPVSLPESTGSSEIKGVSYYTNELRRKVDDFGRTDMPILILGPTGTGKELIARAIHGCSVRSARPMITVNSSAIPEHLEESEFFGHARGAYTGASQAKDGIIRCADGSSLFLDEVAELSLRMQAKLLRVLDNHDYFRVGETIPQKANFRLISATNRPLVDMIKAGLFREDLYFRIRAATIVTQPLARHKEDIPVLINYFMNRLRAEKGTEFTLNVDAFDMLMHYTWPGNIRELKHTVELLCTMSKDGAMITRESVVWVLSMEASGDSGQIVPFSTAKKDFERAYYRTMLIKYNGNISMASRAAGIERAYFSKRLRALGIEKELLRPAE